MAKYCVPELKSAGFKFEFEATEKGLDPDCVASTCCVYAVPL